MRVFVNVDELKAQMRKHRMSVRKTAIRSGIDPHTLYRILKVGSCWIYTLDQVAYVLDVKTESLIVEDQGAKADGC